MMKWPLDYTGELSHICLPLQVGGGRIQEHMIVGRLLQRYERWRNAGSTSGENIYSNSDRVSQLHLGDDSSRECSAPCAQRRRLQMTRRETVGAK